MIELWNYYRSGTSHRVRIALNLKGLDWQYRSLNLLASDHKQPAYLDINPQGLAPALVVDGEVFTQSPAILEYLEEAYPTPPLLPTDTAQRAKVRAMAMIIGCDIHPLNNLRVITQLKALTQAQEPPVDWIGRWISEGFAAIEALLARDPSRAIGCCFGDQPGLVECYLVPQVYAARRFGIELSSFPAICAIDAYCATLPAFQAAHPDLQPDTPQ